MSSYKRSDRVSGWIHRELATIIRRDLKDPRVGPLSITNVWVSGDLRLARIDITPLGGGDPTEIVAGLQAAKGFLRHMLGKKLKIRYTPELHFRPDQHLNNAVETVIALQSLVGEE